MREILHFPLNVHTPIFDASVMDGGLGIPALRWVVPLLAKNRTMDVKEHLLRFDGIKVNNKNKILLGWKQRLRRTCDGTGLAESCNSPHAHKWI